MLHVLWKDWINNLLKFTISASVYYCAIIVRCEKVLHRLFGLTRNGMDQSENLFLTNLRERKRKRSDISQALETVKSTSLSVLDDRRNTLGELRKSTYYGSLNLLKVLKALQLVNIIWEIPSGLPKPTKKTLLTNYCSKFSEIRGDVEVERCVRLLQFLTEGIETHNYVQKAVEILAPLVDNCINWNKALVAQNQVCSCSNCVFKKLCEICHEVFFMLQGLKAQMWLFKVWERRKGVSVLWTAAFVCWGNW